MPSTSASSKLCRVWRIAPGWLSEAQIIVSTGWMSCMDSSRTSRQTPASKSLHFMNANCRRPACTGSPDAQSAASVENVPEPHIGSMSGVPGRQPLSASNPAASTSLRGAFALGGRYPRWDNGAPVASTLKVTLFPAMCRWSLTSGRTRSMLGRWPVLPRNRSTTASFKRKAAKWSCVKTSECTVASTTNVPSTGIKSSQAKRALWR